MTVEESRGRGYQSSAIGNREEKPETPVPHLNEEPWASAPFEVRVKSRAAHPLKPAKGRPPKILGVGCATRQGTTMPPKK
jgi:hypothetical protein